MAELACAASPAALAGAVLFDSLAALLRQFPAAELPDHARLNALLQDVAPQACSGGGAAIRFVAPLPEGDAYELRIHARGEVPTRSDNWHDFFNALAWCVWPRAKAACNALHVTAIHVQQALGATARGALRDALTQFDECGILVVSSDHAILAALAAHHWHAAFWQNRERLLATTRFLVFGHGSWEQLRQPFAGLCAKAIYRQVDAAWLSLPAEVQQAESDAWLATRLQGWGTTGVLTPRALFPLPLPGIPGVVAGNAHEAYYHDSRQFRPRRTPLDPARIFIAG